MEISKQIKRFRLESGLSQEDLAEKVFVTRQTISNWENGKNYPDINSIVLLSTLLDVSLDILVKGDLKKMKEEIKREDIKKLNNDSMIFTVLIIATVASAAPLFHCIKFIGIILWLVLAGITMLFALRIEKQKKAHDIQTYKEILAFTEGKRLDEIDRIREQGKRPYQKVLCIIIAGLSGFIISIALSLLLKSIT